MSMRSSARVLMSVCFGLALGSSTTFAGALGNLTMTPSNTTVAATTSYTLTFRAPSTAMNNTRSIRINNAAGTGGNTNFDNATLGSASGGLIVSVGLAAPTELYLNVTSGSVAANTLVTLVFNGIVSPAQTNGNGYTVQVEDQNTFTVIDSGTAPGTTYTANPAPILTQNLPDHSNREAQSGQFIAVANLNTHFADGDGDTLVFSISNNTLPGVALAQIVGNSLRITPLSFGTTTVTVQASDNAEGTASDSFTVGAIGQLSSASVTPADPIIGRTSNYTLAFNTATTLSSGDFVILQHDVGGPNHSASALQSISGGLSASKTAGGTSSTVLQITAGSVGPGQPVSIVLSGLVNPASVSTGPQYLIDKTDGVQSEDRARIVGTSYIAPPVNIFANGFE